MDNNQSGHRPPCTITEMPDLEQVYSAIKAMYEQQEFKETASKWLEELQRSVYAWKISDQLLMKQLDYQCCYFAANTLKSKILQSFTELPVESHASLKDSIINHMINMNEKTIQTQLGLSLTYIFFLSPNWENPIEELSTKLPRGLFVEILVCIGQEFDENRPSFKLSKKRRTQIEQYLSRHFANILQLLLTCFQEASNMDPESGEKLIVPCLRCFEAWLNFCKKENVSLVQSILVVTLNYLKNPDCPFKIHEPASDALCKVIYKCEAQSMFSDLRVFVIEQVYGLECAFQNAIALEDSPKLTNFTNVFVELGNSTVEFIIYDQVDTKILQLILNCVSHYDFDVAEITFGFWYNFAELVRKHSQSDTCTKFAPFFNLLFTALTRHCQIDSDHQGIIDDKSEVFDYRIQIKDMIEEISVCLDWANYIKSINLVEQFQPTTPWEIVESHLYVLFCIASEKICFYQNPYKDTVLPQIVTCLLALPNNANPVHVQVYATACDLLGELHTWIKESGIYLQPTVGFLITVITSNHDNCTKLSTRAGSALKHVLSDMRADVEFSWGAKLFVDLVNLYSQIDRVELGVPILASCTAIISNPNMEKCDDQELMFQQLIQLCLSKINNILDGKTSVEERKRRWEKIIDHIHAVFKNLRPNEKTKNSPVIHNYIRDNIWIFLKESITQFAPIDSQVIEHCSRVVRHIVRSMKPSYLLQPIVDHIVPLFQQYPNNSSLLYIGSVLVDEFADRNNPILAEGLIRMLNAFSISVFQYLNEKNLNLNPYMVDDYYNLCTRVMLRLTEHFMSNTQTLNGILNFSLMAMYLAQKEANDSLNKFLVEFFKVDYDLKTQYMYNDFGRNIFYAMIDSIMFELPGYFIPDMVDTIWTFRKIYPELYDRYLQYTTENLYAKVQKEGYNISQENLKSFFDGMTRATNPKPLVSEMRYLQRLFN